MTTVAAANPPLSKVAVAWKAFLLLMPLVIAGMLLLLRQAEVKQLRSRTISSYGSEAHGLRGSRQRRSKRGLTRSARV